MRGDFKGHKNVTMPKQFLHDFVMGLHGEEKGGCGMTQIVNWCGVNKSTTAEHEPSLYARWLRGDFDGMSRADAREAAEDPAFIVGSCRSCNSSKRESVVGVEPGKWDPQTSPENREIGGPGSLPWDPKWGSQ